MIWKNSPTLEGLNMMSQNTINEHLGIEFTEIGDNYLVAKMPVDHRTKQPVGLLHGGASLVLAETLGSLASLLLLDNPVKQSSVGVEINANHLRAVRSGHVTGRVEAVKLGRRLHIWQIKIKDDEGRDSCISRITVMIVDNS